jgi:hypothetical protein
MKSVVGSFSCALTKVGLDVSGPPFCHLLHAASLLDLDKRAGAPFRKPPQGFSLELSDVWWRRMSTAVWGLRVYARGQYRGYMPLT